MVGKATISSQAKLSYIALYSIRRTFATSPSTSSSRYHPSDFSGQPFTGSYEPGAPTFGPLGDASMLGGSRLTPKVLKQYLDQFVVGQERAKKKLCVAVYNHYQRVQELRRRDEEEEELLQHQARRDMGRRYSFEEEAPDQQPSNRRIEPYPGHRKLRLEPPITDYTPLTVEKSNIMLLGPSGVGKTLMAKTLARVLEVPFSISDCTPFTQAGYIGEDADVCVQRLLAAANYDVARAEHGIICLDEIDKIAAAKVNHGKDVSGEGVQQALLKIIEGTTLQISAKQEKGAGRPSSGGGYPGGSSVGSGGGGSGKNEVYNVRTDNILFICMGAFIGLQKIILDRVSRGSMGFGQPIRATNRDSSQTLLKGEEHLFKEHLPFFSSNPETARSPLDFVQPGDLQKYGLIPELVGRIPVTTAFSPLDEESLVRVLTEPRNALMKQYEQLFQLSGVELRCTSGALREIARAALGMETGARGLRTVLERLLGDAMFEAPGSSIKFVLVTEAVSQRKQAPLYFARGQQHKFHAMIAAEEEDWEARRRKDNERGATPAEDVRTFERYREKAKASGVI